MDTRDDKVLGFIQKCEQLFPGYRWKTLQKGFNGLARFNVFNESLHRDTRTCKYWGSAEYLWRDGDDSRDHETHGMQKRTRLQLPSCNRASYVESTALPRPF